MGRSPSGELTFTVYDTDYQVFQGCYSEMYYKPSRNKLNFPKVDTQVKRISSGKLSIKRDQWHSNDRSYYILSLSFPQQMAWLQI